MDNKKVKVGMKVKIIGGNGHHHSIPPGTITRIASKHGGDWMVDEGQYLRSSMFEPAIRSKTEIQGEINSLQAEIKDLEDRLDFMKKSKNEEFDEDEFKCWKALRIVESSKDEFEKAQALAKLIKG